MSTQIRVPFFRPDIQLEEIDEVVDTLRSGWLTTGPKVRRFERDFASAVGGRHALAVNSCTAALHLAAEALGLQPGDGVLVPTMTFAATAEVLRYLGAIPILVDCDPVTLNMDLADAARKLSAVASRTPLAALPSGIRVVGIVPVHVAGLMMDMHAVSEFARQHGLWVVEDAAHAFPAAWRPTDGAGWQRCGEGTARVSCFSFYANKTITTGEGGMAVTDDDRLAQRMRVMALHGLSTDAWERYAGKGGWDYRIIAPGFKYNLTDIAASLGVHQVARAEEMRRHREAAAGTYRECLTDVEEIELPIDPDDRIHSWHLFPIRLRLEQLAITRDQFIHELSLAGVASSVHWRPLHLHPYYMDTFGWRDDDLPTATSVWARLISLPIFSTISSQEIAVVTEVIKTLCHRHRRRDVRLRTSSRRQRTRSLAAAARVAGMA
jgi:perosamine synthetase